MTASEPASDGRSRRRLSIGAAIVLALVVLSVAVGMGILRGQAPPAQSLPMDDDKGGASAVPDGELYVHVLGEVHEPGLYVLHLDARLIDALAAAGGTTDAADLQAVNLARVVTDGEQIIVPPVGGAGVRPGAPPLPQADARIDLNTADQAALETLPRIGPALAERIIAWREENGRFTSVDDLLAVPGIGEKMLAGLRDGVRV
ncbi:ComEA family DNA-binding protein [Microbacterium sp.]|uniref:ComEA family DNA-binding protein n=1 Tax=Microbacterium sp. TaxID=51671 RepID=UPI002810D616|nr:ComEA family DNA-binding protein [Microbacterium sp.]